MSEENADQERPGRLTGISSRAGTVKELFQYISRKRLWGMVVLVSVLMIVSLLVITAQAVSYLAPFVYTLF